MKTTEELRKKSVFVGVRLDAETAERLRAAVNPPTVGYSRTQRCDSMSRVIRKALSEYLKSVH
jgi:hypothetical protein